MKSDVKPVILPSSSANGVLFTGSTRLRAFIIQSTGSSGNLIINGLANSTTVSSSTNTNLYIPISVGAGATETLYIPEDGVVYAGGRAGNVGVVDGIGVTANTSGLSVILFIDK